MEDKVKKIDMNEIRRLQKAARDGNKQHLADWFLQFDEQVRNEHKKYAEDVIMKANREMRAEYEKAFKEELAEAIDNYIIAIAYTLKFSELTKFGPKRTKEFLQDVSATVNMFTTKEYTPEEYKKILAENGIELFIKEEEKNEV